MFTLYIKVLSVKIIASSRVYKQTPNTEIPVA